MSEFSVAIIGIGCRFPGANNPEEFWKFLCNGSDAVTEVPESRWKSQLVDSDAAKTVDKMNPRWGGFLNDVDQFDAEFFGISHREAKNMDPQQRLLLKTTWEALENAGQIPKDMRGSSTGVFIGMSTHDYSVLTWNDPVNEPYSVTGTANSIAANRISYVFDFNGPSLTVDTACSSSLIAVHMACQSLQTGESSLALAGGVNVLLLPALNTCFAKAGFMSPVGRCKAFDASADGYVRSEGAAVVVLKPLCSAYADGDPIYAVIRGSAINHNGRSNGLTAPNTFAQEKVLREAYKRAGIIPGRVQYVEAHATGTSLGDPMEMKALGKVMLEGRSPQSYCTVGSVKTNLGHLEAAAGIAGLIKVALLLKNKYIPPTVHFKQPNPLISFEKMRLRVAQTLEPLVNEELPSCAGVSSFGFGGANAHVVLEEFRPSLASNFPKSSSTRPVNVLTLTARSKNALKALAKKYCNFLVDHPELEVADICFTTNTRRSSFSHRLSVIAQCSQTLQNKLANFALKEEQSSELISSFVSDKATPAIAFLFTGQGSQYVNMGRELYESSEVFRSSIDRCDAILSNYLNKSIIHILYSEEKSSLLNETYLAQPAIFSLEYALVELWKSWGITPSVVMGHSLGEYVAAYCANVFSLEDALKLVAERGRLMQELPDKGGMAVVFANELQVNSILEKCPEVSLAALNGPEHFVISANEVALNDALRICDKYKIKTKKLRVSNAFHSPLIEPALETFERVASEVQFSQPTIGLISNITGNLVGSEIATPQYWCRHARQPVQFARSIDTLKTQNFQIFLEIGPDRTLSNMGQRCFSGEANHWFSSLRSGISDWTQITQSLSKLYSCGVTIDWLGFDNEFSRKIVPLPSYPFQESSFPLNIGQISENNDKEETDSPIQVVRSKNIQALPHQKVTPKDLDNSLNLAYLEMPVLKKLASSSDKSRKNILTDYVQSEIAKLVGIDQFDQSRVRDLPLNQKFIDMGLTSLLSIELTRNLESSLNCTFNTSLLVDYPNIEKLVNYIERVVFPENKTSEYQSLNSSILSNNSPLKLIKSNGSKLPLFFIPGATGTTFYLQYVARYFDYDRPIYGLEMPNLNSESFSCDSVQELAKYYSDAIEKKQPEHPIFLAGHSFGGRVVFEVAQQLQKRGRTIGMVAIIDMTAPLISWDVDLSDTRIVSSLIMMFANFSRYSLSMNYSQLLSCELDELYKLFLNQLSMAGLRTNEARVELAHHLVRVVKVNLLALASYIPEDVIPVPISLYRATEIERDVYQNLMASEEVLECQDMGWQQFSNSSVEVNWIQGNHISIITEPSVKILAEKMSKCFDSVSKQIGILEDI